MTTVAREPAAGLGADALSSVDALRAHAAGPRVALALVEALEAAPASQGPLPLELLTDRLTAHGLVWEDARAVGGVHPLEALTGGGIPHAAAEQLEVLLAMALAGWLETPGAEPGPVVRRWEPVARQALRRLHLNPYRFVLAVLGPDRAEATVATLVDGLGAELRAAAADQGGPFGARAACVLQIEAVTAALPPRLREPLLARLAAAADTPVARRLLAGYMDDASPQLPPPAPRPSAARQRAPVTVDGDTRPAPRRPLTALLLSLCGWTLLEGLWELIRRGLLRGRRSTHLELRGELLRVRRTSALLARDAEEQRQIVPLTALQGWGVEQRGAPLLTLVGVAAFSLGGVLGLFTLFDSLQAGFPLFGLVGLLVVGLGVGLDLGLHLLVRRSLSRSTVWIRPAGQPALRVGGLPSIEARRFVEAVEEAHRELRPTR